MGAIVIIFLYGAAQLLGKQGYQLSTETGTVDRAAFAHTIIGYEHL